MGIEDKVYDRQFEAWKRRRAEAESPGDFADKVMASVRAASGLRRWVWVHRVRAAVGRSRFLQMAVYLAAAALLVLRVAAFLAAVFPAC
jgi:hypothetical protein